MDMEFRFKEKHIQRISRAIKKVPKIISVPYEDMRSYMAKLWMDYFRKLK